MKYFANLFGWTVVLVVAVLTFVFFYQKEQNEHVERMVENAVNNAQQKRSSIIDIIQVEEEKSLKRRIQDGIKSAIAFVFSIFSKL